MPIDTLHQQRVAESRVFNRAFQKLKFLVKGGDQPTGSNLADHRTLDPSGVITDQKLLQYAFALKGEDVQPITTDKFLDKSREQYNEAWLTREIVQNFVDHNPTEPGTLNGVQITSKDIGGVREGI